MTSRFTRTCLHESGPTGSSGHYGGIRWVRVKHEMKGKTATLDLFPTSFDGEISIARHQLIERVHLANKTGLVCQATFIFGLSTEC